MSTLSLWESRTYADVHDSWYNAAELIFLVFLRFKKKSGLYFWSMLITSISIIVYQFGAWGKMVNISNKKLFSLTFMNVGWYGRQVFAEYATDADSFQDIHDLWTISRAILPATSHHTKPPHPSDRPLGHYLQHRCPVHSHHDVELCCDFASEKQCLRERVRNHGEDTNVRTR